jgi:hypothetical protein
LSTLVRLRHRSKALFTAATGADFAPLLKLSRPGFEDYAQRHRWDLVVVEDDRAQGRPPAWAKVPILRDALRRYELVVWIDADALIVDASRDLAGELRRGRDLYLVEHTNAVTGDVTVNTGVLMLRAGAWADRFLAAVWARDDLVEHVWWENAAVMDLLGYRIAPPPARRGPPTPWRKRVRLLDVAWNSLPDFDASARPRIVHFAGIPLAERRERMLASRRVEHLDP